MESVHVMFDDKKIQGFEDEGFHETLQFENKTDGDMECDSGDDDLVRSVNIGGNIPSTAVNASTASTSDVNQS